MNSRKVGIALMASGIVVAAVAGGPLIYFDQLAGGCPNFVSLYGQCSAANPPIPGAAIVAILVGGVIVAALGRWMIRRSPRPPGSGL